MVGCASGNRVVLALALAPLVLPTLLYLHSLIRSWILHRPDAFDYAAYVWAFSPFWMPFAYAAELLFGVPAWLLFRRRRVRSWLAFAAAGGIIGLSTTLLVTGLQPWSSPDDAYLASLLVLGASASALVFRAIVFGACSHPSPPLPSEK